MEEAAVREAREETGLETEVVRTGEPYFNVAELGKWKVYPVLLKSGSREVEMSEEHDKCEWIEISEVELLSFGFDFWLWVVVVFVHGCLIDSLKISIGVLKLENRWFP